MESFLLTTITPITLALSSVAFIVASLVRGWLVPRATVLLMIEGHKAVSTQAALRADDYRALYLVEKERGDVLQGIVSTLTVVAETSAKILQALPAGQRTTESKKVE